MSANCQRIVRQRTKAVSKGEIQSGLAWAFVHVARPEQPPLDWPPKKYISNRLRGQPSTRQHCTLRLYIYFPSSCTKSNMLQNRLNIPQQRVLEVYELNSGVRKIDRRPSTSSPGIEGDYITGAQMPGKGT